MRNKIQEIVVKAVAGTIDITTAIDNITSLINGNSDKLLLFNDNSKLTIQRSEYIEDGAFIEVIGDEITVCEIPMYGGEEKVVGKYKTLIEAICSMNKIH